MAFSSPAQSAPLALPHDAEAQVYGLTALELALTLIGIIFGMQYVATFFGSALWIVFVIAELGIVLTARWWMTQSPLNAVLFGLFPLLSGVTITPFILAVLEGYANGGGILLNAAAATLCMTAAAAVFARTTRWNLGALWKGLFLGLLGLLFLGLLQVFFPSLQTGQMELFVSGAGVVIFALFLVADLQRIRAAGRAGAHPFLLALSLYLDIFNLFLYIVRFMLVISGNRRRSW